MLQKYTAGFCTSGQQARSDGLSSTNDGLPTTDDWIFLLQQRANRAGTWNSQGLFAQLTPHYHQTAQRSGKI